MSELTAKGQAFHLIGIGGAGMSVVAELLAGQGATVTGSDRHASEVTAHLEDIGVEVSIGHDAAHVPAEATVVVSTAIRESNPELMIARGRAQRVMHRSQALAVAAEGMRFVAVAGAHGKTTTSGMLSVALFYAGADPSVAVGGVLAPFGSGAHVGTGSVFVAEADESDGSFLNYRPDIAIVTNVEPDHLDRYDSDEAFEDIFWQFVQRLSPAGVLVACGDDPGAARLARRAREAGIRVITYGSARHGAQNIDVTFDDVELMASGSRATVNWGDLSAPLRLTVPGIHNVVNATAAWIVGVELGVTPSEMTRALELFTGAARRFEFKGQVGSRRLYDDYAHHPTEVEAAIREARLVAGEADVTVVFQPHLFSRTRIFADRFARALSLADRVVVTDIYAAREDPEPGVTSELITDRIPGARYVADMHEAARIGASLTGQSGVLVTMGAGSITQCGLDALRQWEREQL